MYVDKALINELLEAAKVNPRLRSNKDLRTSQYDNSQRMLNGLQPGTVVPVHRHTATSETVVVLHGRLEEVYYEVRMDSISGNRTVIETERILLSADGPVFGLDIPKGQWHTVSVLEPTVILECKDGAYQPLSPDDVVEIR